MAKDKVKAPEKKGTPEPEKKGLKLPFIGKKDADPKAQQKTSQKGNVAPAKRKRGFMARLDRIVKYFREMIAELKKATWPSKKELAKYTGIVLAFVTILAVVVGLLDLGFTSLLKLITG